MVIKRRKISELTSKKLNLPIELIDDLISEFYGEFQTHASSMEKARLNVPGLGQFFIVKKRLKSRIIKVRKVLEFMESKNSTSIARYETRLAKKTEIEKMEDMLETINKQQQEKREFKKKYRG